MKLKQIESFLTNVKVFENPKPQLEQYPTTAHLAAQFLHTVASIEENFENAVICDLGCGCGMLSIAASILGAECCLAVDIDEEALELARENIEELFDEGECSINLIHGALSSESSVLRPDSADIVVMNPPFGTKTEGIDMVFLKAAVDIATTSVYSLHKTSTRNHIIRKAAEWGVDLQVVAEMRFDIPRMYRFHTKERVDVAVDLLRLDVRRKG
eukprot:GCRY01007786.1.p1 GENE.GCRY01007786.1~~GCRY01007786.1.p1  ORF type:complete len:214 (+),score=51.07 GCRY01007786.1:197-838(+)